MANSDKNILISPNRGQTAQPSIVFTGQGNDPISLKVLDSTVGAISLEGSAGQLFSVTDNLTTGSIFSVNDVSGMPSIDVDANGTVELAPFGGNVGVGTTNPTSKLHVSGGDLHVNSLDGNNVDIKLSVENNNNFSIIRSIRASDSQSILSFNINNGGLKEVAQFHYDEGLYVKGTGDGTTDGNAGLITFSDQSGTRLAQITSYKTGVGDNTDLIFSTYDENSSRCSEKLRITSTGNVGVGTDNPTTKLHVIGDILASGNVTAYSDLQLKDNIKSIDNAIEKVLALRGVSFTRIDTEDKDKKHIGVIAQEVEQVLPEVVQEHSDGIKSVAYGNMVGLLIEAIKEQQNQIESLKAEIESLKRG